MSRGVRSLGFRIAEAGISYESLGIPVSVVDSDASSRFGTAGPSHDGKLSAVDHGQTCRGGTVIAQPGMEERDRPDLLHREHQMYPQSQHLLEDEADVLKIASDPELLDKKKGGDAKLFLDVLIEKGWSPSLNRRLALRLGFAGQDNLGKYADGSKAGRNQGDFLELNTFAFSFSPSYVDLFNKISKLKHFRNEDPPPDQIGIYKHKFKMLVCVPAELNCKYATKVRDGVRGKNDFGLNEYGRGTTPVQYCRPLPYEFKFRRDGGVGTVVHIQ